MRASSARRTFGDIFREDRANSRVTNIRNASSRLAGLAET
jgi:hypothetical protein